jgi:competence protein ComEC
MTGLALGFALGVVLLQLQAALPAPGWLWALPACAAALGWKPLRLPAALAIGFLWAAGAAHLRLADRLAPEHEGRDLEVAGVVASLPSGDARATRFEFEIESPPDLPRRVRLVWFRAAGDETELHPGERWLMTVRLKRPHGQVNPHGFDYEAWLIERGIGATGYVRSPSGARRLGERSAFMDRVEQAREAVRSRFFARLGETPAAGILAALAVGDQRAIADEEWRLFQRTGVTHLMSISGLHVTLVSGLVAWLAGALWRRSRLALALPARKAAAIAAVAAALGYTLLAGFAVPAQRTFWMVTVVAAALWAGRIAAPARTLALAAAVVLAFDPWAPLAPGFLLSFGAVALIFYVGTGWSTSEPKLLQWARIQWAITAGLAPAALLLFGQVSLAGPLANAIAIPLVSVVVTPLALAAALAPLEALVDTAAWLTERLLEFLEACAALPNAVWEGHAPQPWAVAMALAGVAWLLAPRGVPWRIAGLALLGPAFALPPEGPPEGEAWITTLDVGQGLAVVVRTARHALLYDAGPAWGQSDGGVRVVLPYLRSQGVTRLDAFVMSHDDTDHVGGAESVLATLETDLVLSSLPAHHALHMLAPAPRRCVQGLAWQWDGVRFEIVHPRAADYERARRNDLSCVLRVAAGRHAMLLTGDIERRAEAALAKTVPGADVLLVPHHGSRTSSSAEFIQAVAPQWAVVSVGYRSRFGHPHPAVLERYGETGARMARTDLQGAIGVRLTPAGVSVRPERERRPRYWRVPPSV